MLFLFLVRVGGHIYACGGLTPGFTISSTGCGIPRTITITNTTTGINASTSSFIWKVNGTRFDSTYNTATGTFYTTALPGSYTFKLIARTSAGCYDSSVSNTVSISTNAAPVYDGLFNPVFNPVWTNCIVNPLATNSYTVPISSPDTLTSYTIVWGDASANSTGTSLLPGNTI
ncbi:MAG: hypothetical protein ACHQK8_09480, partial [Bacteroidia bacterium]